VNLRYSQLTTCSLPFLYSLNDILGLIVNEKDNREVTVEFRSWRSTQYFLDDRDNFLATMAELMGMGKGTEFSIRLEPYFPHTLPDKLPAAYQVSSSTCIFVSWSLFMTLYLVDHALDLKMLKIHEVVSANNLLMAYFFAE
jgi:hypothetical protein